MDSEQLATAARVRAMKVGDQIEVKTDKERQEALDAARTLRRAGVIDFSVLTRKMEGGGYIVVAV